MSFSLFGTGQRMAKTTDLLLEISLYLLPVFFLLKRSYATSIYVWITAFYLLSLLLQRRRPRFTSPVSRTVVFFLISVIAASLITIGPSDTWREAKPLIYGVVFFFILMDQIRGKPIIRTRYLGVLVCLSLFLSLDAIWQHYSGTDLLGRNNFGDRATSVFLNPNYLGFFLSGAVPVYAYFIDRARTITVRVMWIIVLLPCLVAILFSGTRSAWAAVLLFYVVRACCQPRVRARLVSLCVPFVLIMSLLYFFGHGIILDRMKSTEHFFESDRILIWEQAVKIIKIHPVRGSGLDSYREYHPIGSNILYSAPHFFPFEIWQTSGIAALVLFCFLLYKVAAVSLTGLRSWCGCHYMFWAWFMVFLSSIISIPFFSRYVSTIFWLYLGLLFGAYQADGDVSCKARA